MVSALVRVAGWPFLGSEPRASVPTMLYAWLASPGGGAASVDSVRWLREALFAVERVEDEPERELREPEEEELGFTRRALGASASSLQKGKRKRREVCMLTRLGGLLPSALSQSSPQAVNSVTFWGRSLGELGSPAFTQF